MALAPVDRFQGYPDGPLNPARQANMVTPHDTNPLPVVAKGLYIGGGGDVTVRAVDSPADAVYKAMPAGSYINVQIAYVRNTGTSATFIVAEV
ncbi:MAG TPA: hypothetical protein VFW22_16415 [Pseudolabrys sp.]|nr:hypothetical protein [Pseudolabrys sp.]